MEEFDTLDISEKTIAILGDKMVATGGETGKGDTISKKIPCAKSGNNVMSARQLEVSLLGAGTMLRLEKEACFMVK